MIRVGRVMALMGYGLLLIAVVGGAVWWSPPTAWPVAAVLLLKGGPLLLLLRPLLHNRRLAHAWSSLLALLYFIYAVDGLAAGRGWPATLECVAALLWFAGSLVYLRGLKVEGRGRD